MTAAEIARALDPKASRSGRNWIVKCPCHDDRQASLSLADGDGGRVLVRCFANCDPRAILDHLRQRGLIEGTAGRRRRWRAPVAAKVETPPDPRVAIEVERILGGCIPLAGTLGEVYLCARGLDDPKCPDLLFHPDVTDYASRRGWPALIGVVRDAAGQPTGGLHRTLLHEDGSGKAPIERAKAMKGPCRGGAVQLITPTEGRLIVGEGIESTLAAWSLMRDWDAWGCWAALSTSGLKALALPDVITDVLICGDNDANGAGQNAAREAAQDWKAPGRRARLAFPPKPDTDWNDVLTQKVARRG